MDMKRILRRSYLFSLWCTQLLFMNKSMQVALLDGVYYLKDIQYSKLLSVSAVGQIVMLLFFALVLFSIFMNFTHWILGILGFIGLLMFIVPSFIFLKKVRR